MEVFLDIMKESDLYHIIKIEKEAFSNPWNVKFFREELNYNIFALYLTAKVNKEVVGYTGCWFKDKVKEIHIVNLAIKKEFRRKNIATYLINEIINMAKTINFNKITLEVRASNEKAINLYEKLDFKKTNIVPNYYLDNKEDAILMIKELKNE
ncbi:MAG: ribosomal protein S18-alanine N-acetyltransferase [Halanaerobiales bacterium]|nr:ribosomal protein S18-alanine N-acetyltransferase [Halanaerobiales bacterium]